MAVLNLTKEEAFALYNMVDMERGMGAVADAQRDGLLPMFDCDKLLRKIALIAPMRDEIAGSFDASGAR